MSALYDSFKKYFEIVIADTPELLEYVYRIRYQVLCVEKRIPGFDPILYPDKLEKDDYDSRSSHALLRFRPSGDFIATVRLIFSDLLHPENPFPVETYAPFDPTLYDITALPRQYIAEISRSVVVSQFERRGIDRYDSDLYKNNLPKQKVSINSEKGTIQDRSLIDRRSGPPIALILMASVVRISTKYDIKSWISSMEPALNRLLRYYGLGFNPAGPLVNHHGIRRPYFARVEDVLNRMYQEHYDAWEVVTDRGKYHSPYLLMEKF